MLSVAPGSDSPPKPAEVASAPPAPLLRARGLRAGYAAADVVCEVDLEVEAGACHAIVGANGAGKTTLLSALSGLLSLRAGELAFAGSRIDGLSVGERLRRGLVHCPEGRRVFAHMSVADNLALGAYLCRDQAERSDRLAAVYARFPKLHERRRQLAGTMSGGEQQLLALGRALMARPTLLLLDEPSLGLAPKVAEEVFAAIAELTTGGMTIVLVEQNAAMALRLAKTACVLEHGRVAFSAAAKTLLGDPRIQRAYLGG